MTTIAEIKSYFADDQEAWFVWTYEYTAGEDSTPIFIEDTAGEDSTLIFIEEEERESHACGKYGFINKERMPSALHPTIVPLVLLRNLIQTLNKANIECRIQVNDQGQFLLYPY